MCQCLQGNSFWRVLGVQNRVSQSYPKKKMTQGSKHVMDGKRCLGYFKQALGVEVVLHHTRAKGGNFLQGAKEAHELKISMKEFVEPRMLTDSST